MFLDPYEFPFARQLEDNWRAIRAELDRLPENEFTDWKGTYYKLVGKWQLYGFFMPGRRWDVNCLNCPQTVALLDSIPGVTMAGFSRLSARSHITPHRGECGAVLRMHLALSVPGPCRLRVGSEVRAWQEGKTLLFDDTLEHEAFNESEHDRTVLILDFYRPWRHRKSALQYLRDRAAYRKRQTASVAMRAHDADQRAKARSSEPEPVSLDRQ